ncbi:thioredoxin domain-containing protein [Dactylosporangium sp. NPDC049140]|uniref:DsbA family protein n=1 Tax=Dactylosporangium sp. NPDC049140 TaxID=3155647 RepID=UPI00340A1BF5
MHVQGRSGAPLSLVEYGDYESPEAGRAFGVVERIQLHYGDRLRFEFRHFPLVDAHPRAMPAALLAEAAADADAFWGMHALLLTHQDQLEDGDLARYAERFGLPDTGGRREHHERVLHDMADGRARGVEGGSVFFVNGLMHEGPNDFTTLSGALGVSEG